jgi:hypothetical protein
MNADKVQNIVEDTFTRIKLSVVNQHQGLTWKDQLKAALNLIPEVGGMLAQEFQNLQDYRDSEFFRKYTVFIMELSDTTVEQRCKFAKEVGEKAHDAPGSVIANMVDALDNINKEKYFAQLSKAKINGLLSIEDYFRLSSMLARIPYTDLDKLSLYQEEYYDEDGDTELLYSTGVLRMAKVSEEGDKYILSPLGEKFMKFVLGSAVKVKHIKGTKPEMLWGEPVTNDEIQNIVNKSLAEAHYQETDQAMFDLDFVRGK